MKRLEIQAEILKNKVSNKECLVSDVTKENVELITKKNSVIEFGGIGATVEYLCQNGLDCTLCDESSLARDYRVGLFPNTKVEFLNVNPLKLNFSKPVFDYIIINDLSYLETAKKLAIKGIINNVTDELILIEEPKKAKTVAKTKKTTKPKS